MSTVAETTIVLAREIRAGDTLLVEGGIDLPIIDIRPKDKAGHVVPIHGFVIVDYDVGFATDARTLVADQRVTVRRPAEEAGH